MTRYDEVRHALARSPRTWLVTGAAGFIGSNLVEALLRLDQRVVGVDNFATGHRANLDDVAACVGEARWRAFRFLEGDIQDPELCASACAGVDVVLHQAALGSVPRSIDDPWGTHASNVDGFVRLLLAARDAGVHRFVYAGSSSVYGDDPELPKVENRIGRPLSPYAVTKLVDEHYAGVFQRAYGLEAIGLRYFNVFGRRQDPAGAYAAVIPRWVAGLLSGVPCEIYGDGETSRDFCYIENVVQANLLAGTTEDAAATDQVYNVACGERTTLNELFTEIRDGLVRQRPELAGAAPLYRPFRSGDVRHSLADISRGQRLLGYVPTHRVRQGLAEALTWYVEELGPGQARRAPDR